MTVADERRDKGPNRGQGGGRPQAPGPKDARPQDGKADEGRRGRFGRRRFGKGGAQGSLQGQAAPGAQGNAKEAAPEVHASSAPDFKLEALPKPDPVACPICGKPVYDLSTALSQDREHPTPAHFDCVIERVGAAESLGPNEKLVYMGSGSFGVVEFKDKNETAFVVKRRVQWEKEGEKQDWRKILSARISNL